jgi:hypothetical protein
LKNENKIKMNTLIDIDSGHFQISKKLFYHKMSFEEAHSQSGDFKLKIVDYKNGYKWLHLKEIEFYETFFHFGLCFKNDQLDFIDFGFSSLDELKNTWADWSEEKELSKKELYEKWLTDNVSPKRTFKWGTIATYYDPRGGTSGILVNYN